MDFNRFFTSIALETWKGNRVCEENQRKCWIPVEYGEFRVWEFNDQAQNELRRKAKGSFTIWTQTGNLDF